jgi:hypothetical protein
MLSARGGGSLGLLRKAAPLAQKAKSYLAKAAAALNELDMPLDVKMASVQEYISNSLIWPLAVGGGNLPGRIVSGMFDQAALDIGQKLLAKKRPKSEQGNK